MNTVKLPKKGEWKLVWKFNGKTILDKKYTVDKYGDITWGKGGIKKPSYLKRRKIINRLKKRLPNYFPKWEVRDMLEHQDGYFGELACGYKHVSELSDYFIKRIYEDWIYKHLKSVQKNRHKKRR